MTAVSNIQGGNQVNKALTFTQMPAPKRLSGATEGSGSLSDWYAQAHEYYNAVMSGAEQKPDEAQWNEFINQMNWAYGQLQGTSETWGDEFGVDMEPVEPSVGGDFEGESSDPFGGAEGTMGNLVYTDSDNRIGFIGEERPMDVWGNLTIDCSSNSVQWTVEETTDTRWNPAEKVWKIIGIDKATGKTSTYFVHDITETPPPVLKINTPDGKNVTDAAGIAEVGSYQKPTENDPDARPESSHPVIEENGRNVVEAPVTEEIQLNPAANGADQVWDIYGNYNIGTLPSDTVVVTKTAVGVYTIEVTHRGGEKDTIYTHAGLEGKIYALPENVTFVDATALVDNPDNPIAVNPTVTAKALAVGPGGILGGSHPTYPGTDGVPAGFDNLSLNPGEEFEGGSSEQKGDEPTRMDGSTRVYNDDRQDLSIYPVPEGKDKTTEIDASGIVTITPNDNSEYFKIELVGKEFVISVYSELPADETNLKETIKIDADLVAKVEIKAAASRILNQEELQDMNWEYRNKLDLEEQGVALASPEEIVAKLPFFPVPRVIMEDWVTLFVLAAKSGGDAQAWQTFTEKSSNAMTLDERKAAFRSLTTALVAIVGTEKFREMLFSFPAEVLTELQELGMATN